MSIRNIGLAGIFSKRSNRAAEGWELALEHLDEVVRYGAAVLGSKELAEDVAMEIYHSLLKSRRDLTKLEKPKLYLIGMARRRIADQRRKSFRRREVSLELALDTREPHKDHDAAHDVERVLAQMLEDQREVLVLKYIHELTIEEISELMERTPQAVNSLLQRGRESFAKLAGPGFADLVGGNHG